MRFDEVKDPLAEVEGFQERAREAGLALPEAMSLATVSAEGKPHVRVVLWKGREQRDCFFFTNYESEKARDLEIHPWAELAFHYASLELQARIFGAVTKTSAEHSDAYFASRPRESQLGAWASAQSKPLSSRADLDAAYQRTVERFEGAPVERPPHWGGYALRAERVELWLGRKGRLHDRAEYRFEQGSWAFQLLYP